MSGQPPSVRSLLEELDKAEQSMDLEGDKSTDRPKSSPEVIAGNPDEVLRLKNIAGMTNAQSADKESEATLAPPEQIDTSWDARVQRALEKFKSNSERQKKAGGRRIKSKKRKSPKRKYKKRKSHKRKSKRRSKRR